ARDLGHVARAGGVRAVIDAAAITSATLEAAAAEAGLDALALALHGGEDYALLAILPPGDVLAGFDRIGGIEALAGGAHLALRRQDGEVAALEERGFDHFSGRPRGPRGRPART